MSSRRVAVAGAGPKGLFALERLLHHATVEAGPELDVHVFDPDPDPGAGAVYRPSQPRYLVMNQPAGHVDMWWPGQGVVPPAQRLPFAAWAGCDPSEYVPRAQVGRYLRDGLALVLRHAPVGTRVTFHRQRVTHVGPASGGGWHVHSAAGTRRYDEVLLATGHEPSVPDHALPVFPVERLSGDAVPDGSVISVRGYALTFIDAALALTEGRGGRFDRAGSPHRLRYVPGPGDPVRIHPHSRTGLPILPKPQAVVAEAVPGLAQVQRRALERLEGVRTPCDLHAHVVPALEATAAACLELAGGGSVVAPAEPRAALAHALDVALGAAPPGRDWALGHAWRVLYPALVRLTGAGALRSEDRPAFLGLAGKMERLAFGPAPRNTAKLLALVDAGVVRLDRLARGPLEHADVHVDAVLPGPGVPAAGLLRELVDEGHASLVEGGRGLRVDAQGTCVVGDGSSSTGLAAYGRPTEDGVVGNDTLSRTLHPFIDRWAARVAGDRCSPGPARERELMTRA